MGKNLESELKGSLNVQPRQPLEGCPGDLRQGIIDYWKGRGISIALLKKYYGFGRSLTVVPSEAQLRALYPH